MNHKELFLKERDIKTETKLFFLIFLYIKKIAIISTSHNSGTEQIHPLPLM
jgi:hypothetical protein